MRREDTRMAWVGTRIPAGCPEAEVAAVLDELRVPGGTRDDLNLGADKVRRLATERPATYEYLRLTRFVKARAAELARTGPFAGEREAVLEGIAKYGLQVGGMYLRLLRTAAEERLRQVERLFGGRDVVVLDAWLRINMYCVERDFLKLLEFVCLAVDLTKSMCGFPTTCWVKGELGDGGLMTSELVPAAVAVAVRVRTHGLCLLVMPSAEEQAAMILAGNRGVWYCERYVHGNNVSRELERMSAGRRIEGLPTIRLGDDSIQFFRATMGDAGDTLHVVGLNRTMELRQAGRSPPACVPCEMTAYDEVGDRYLVEFDNNVVDVFTVSFRTHRENEAKVVEKAERSLKLEGRSLKPERLETGNSKLETGGAKQDTGHLTLDTGDTTDRTDDTDGSHEGTKTRSGSGEAARKGAESAKGVDRSGKREVESGKQERANHDEHEGREGGGVTHEELRSTIVEGFGSLKRERVEDALKAQAQTVTIQELAQGPDKFLAGLNARMSKDDVALLVELVTKVEVGGRRRPRTYDDIGKRLGGVSRQAVLGRMYRLYARHPTVRAYVETERDTKKEMTFSEGSDSWRRQAGVDEAYGRRGRSRK